MTPADLDALELRLGLRLPETYRKLVADFPAELRRWPSTPGRTWGRKTAFLFDPEKLASTTERLRKRWKDEFPPAGFVVGGDRGGWWVIDTAEPDPAVSLVTPDYILDGFASVGELLETMRADHAEASALAQKTAKAGAAAKLTPEELLEEGRLLARPALALRTRGDDYVAVWKGAGGTGVAAPGEGEWRHWISLDASRLPQNPGARAGVISVYEWWADDDRMGELRVVHDPAASLPAKPDGRRLFAAPFDCLPDVDCIFRFGSPRIREWAATYWDPERGYDRSPVKDYLKVLRREHPFGRGGAHALVGGWSWFFGWCYGTGEEYPWQVFDQGLVVLTLEDSEPWIEVFDDGRTFTAYSRIT